jgi:hypothetical protein
VRLPEPASSGGGGTAAGPPTIAAHATDEWERCRQNVEKDGDYTVETDGLEEYSVKMAARFYVHWRFREAHLREAPALRAAPSANGERAERIALCVEQQRVARKLIDGFPVPLRARINQQIRAYCAKEACYTRREQRRRQEAEAKEADEAEEEEEEAEEEEEKHEERPADI